MARTMLQGITTETVRKEFSELRKQRHNLSSPFVIMTSVLNSPGKASKMFLAFVLVIGFAIVLIKLGAASVMVSVLSMGLQAAVFVIVILAAVLLWKNFSKNEGQGRK